MSSFNFISEGFKGFIRNKFKTVASVITLASTLLLVGIFTTLIVTINQSVSNIDDFNEIVVYMKLDTTNDEVEATYNRIKELNNVKKVTMISKSDALEIEKEKFKDYAYIFESYDDSTNPLPDSFKIEYDELEAVEALVFNLKHLDIDGDGVSDDVIDKVKNRYDIAKNINNFKSAISIGGVWLMLLLVTVSVFVVSNTIKLTYHSREMEISVMRYIGATKSYITLPFIFEGALTGLSSGLLAYLIQTYLYVHLETFAEKFQGFVLIPSFMAMSIYYIPIFFGAGLVIGILGSALAIRRYMKA